MRELPLSEFEGSDKPQSSYRVVKVLAYDSMSVGDAVQSIPIAYRHLEESLQTGERLAFLPGERSIAVLAYSKAAWGVA
jgi:hypothetical protein